MAEIGKNTVQPIVKRKGQILKTVSSPSTSGSKKQVTNIVLDNGVLKASSDNGDTFEDITVKTAQNAQTENAYEIASLVLSDISKTQFKSNTVTATAAIDSSEIVHIASVDTSGLDPALQPYVEGLANLGGITLYRTSEHGFSATFGSVTDVDIRQGLTGSYVLSFIGDETKTYQLFGTVLSDSTGSGISAIFDNAGNPISATYAKKTEVNAKYTKPSTGIPESDLAQAVKDKLNAGGGAEVVANPTETGTEDLTSLQVDGTVYNVSKTEYMTEYMTDAEVDALFLSVPSFAEATWEQIAQVSELNIAQNYFSVGDEKNIELSTGEQITLIILGFNHDELTNGGKAGITIGMKELLATKYQMNPSKTNVNGWQGCVMRTSTMATLLSQLPADLQSVIKVVNKKANAGDKDTSIVTSSDKLWLLALAELGSKTSLENSSYFKIKDNATTYVAEGEQYEYFKNAIGDTDIYTECPALVKKLSNGSGSANIWWLRSPDVSVNDSFWYVSSWGNAYAPISGADGLRAVSFGFCV